MPTATCSLFSVDVKETTQPFRQLLLALFALVNESMEVEEFVDASSFQEAKDLKSVIDRYYEEFYAADVLGKPGEDQFVYIHLNLLCVVGIAANHPINKKTVAKVNFDVGPHDRSQNTVKGKAKKGGQFLDIGDDLCEVTCTDGSTYRLKSCVSGALLEVNDRLHTDPQLLVRSHAEEGYVAIIQPRRSADKKTIASHLLPLAEYRKLRNISE